MKNRDEVSLQFETRLKDDNKPQVFYKPSEKEKTIKSKSTSTRKGIIQLVDETGASFNLKEKTYEYLDPKSDKIIKGNYNRHDLPETLFHKYGDELFPEEKERPAKTADKNRSPQKFSKSIPVGAGQG